MVPALLTELRNRDIRVRAVGDRLQCDAPAGALTPELREQLRRRKDEILDFLRTAESLARQQRAIVPIQPLGMQVPIFGVGGHNGDVFCYCGLANALGKDQPFFGLQPPGLDGHSDPLTDVAAFAAYFAPQIRTFRPDGPCIIAGFCAGGSIAFELARKLAQEGVPIPFVALFGSPYPAAYRALPQLRMRTTNVLDRVTMHTRALAPLSLGEQRRYIAGRLEQRRARQEAARPVEPDAVLAFRERVERATIAAVRRYTPSPSPLRLALFLPNQAWAHSLDMPLRWRTVAKATEEYFGPDDCNGDVMLRDHATAFAELFRECRARQALPPEQ